MRHADSCPAADTGLSKDCVCEAIERVEIDLVERASRPSPAELIRRAKARGLITGVYTYNQTN